ncbi:MAG: AMP-binding protein, partial [Alphaproteobacteria bacterium]|nr:AMP-binding protein [Alphaproteobacteria bacterium]
MTFSPETGWTDISDAVFFHAERRPDAVAVIEGGERVVYGDLAGLVAAATHYVDDLGVTPREVVAVMMPGTIDHLVLTLALIRAGAVPLDLPMPQPGQRAMLPLDQIGIRRAFVAAGAAPPAAATVHIIG